MSGRSTRVKNKSVTGEDAAVDKKEVEIETESKFHTVTMSAKEDNSSRRGRRSRGGNGGNQQEEIEPLSEENAHNQDEAESHEECNPEEEVGVHSKAVEEAIQSDDTLSRTMAGVSEVYPLLRAFR